MKKVEDNFFIGFAAGLLGALFGIMLIYLSRFSHMSIGSYFTTVWQSGITGPVISLGAIVNLIIFYIFYHLKKNKMARGVIASMFFLIVIVLILKVL